MYRRARSDLLRDYLYHAAEYGIRQSTISKSTPGLPFLMSGHAVLLCTTPRVNAEGEMVTLYGA